MNPLNVRELYGDKYKCGLDPAARHERNGRKNAWYFVIRCRYGEIYPYSDTLLAVMVIGPRKVAEIRRAGFMVHQDGDGEAVFLFDPGHFDEVATVVKPRKKRGMSEDQKEEARKRALTNQIWKKRKPPEQLGS